jgi:hypothetical protein
MTEKPETSDSSPLTESRLRLIYVAGVALNVVALATAVRAGELLVAVTFVFVLLYLCVRYWLTLRS